MKLEVKGNRAKARVEGTDQPFYSVGLDWTRVPQERVLHGFCDCQRFGSGRPCKHLWATLLALGEGGAANQPPGRDRLSLRKDDASAWAEALGIEVPAGAALAPAARQRKSRRRAPRGSKKVPAGPTTWRSLLDSVEEQIEHPVSATKPAQRSPRPELHFLLNTSASLAAGDLVVDIFGRSRSSSGALGKLKRASVAPDELQALLLGESHEGAEDEAPSVITAMPADPPKRQARGRRGKTKPSEAGIRRFLLPRSLHDDVLTHLSSESALRWWDGRTLRDPQPLTWDPGDPWRLALRLHVPAEGPASLSGDIERDGDTAALTDVSMVLPISSSTRLVLFGGTLARLVDAHEHDMTWFNLLAQAGEIIIPPEELADALTSLLEVPSLPHLEVPEQLSLTEDAAEPQPCLLLERQPAPEFMTPPLVAALSFDYGSLKVGAEDPRMSIVDWHGGRFLRRDMESEHSALVRLLELGVRPVEGKNGHGLELEPAEVPGLVEPLLTDGWSVEVHGTTVHPASAPALKVESGIDWFELSGEIDFGGDSIEFSDILGAISRGDRFVTLADGSQGLLPADWMEAYDSLAELAQSSSDNGLRFLPSQALLVDALLSATPPADVDAAFAELRQKLKSFERIKPKRELKSFDGELRSYQRQGLGWLDFLREFGLGGVLADDMGLGKTIQVLALIQANRTASKTTKLPFLVVAPRSVVYNWIDEAAHFTPKLKSVEYRGANREAILEKLAKYDLVVTTYGTMRRDIALLAKEEFDTVILDEAQAIKNPSSQTTKASRLLRARHRLALTGTPIENHLGELGSLFEFLNPGLMGRLPWLDVLNSGRTASKRELEVVAEGIRPFILRRTKAQVLPDLPPKTEQVLHCTLRPEQQEYYDQLRAQYQVSLLQQVESEGVSGSAIQVLQALLRLRQVACHPGLVNEEWADAGSAKLETLFEQVEEVLDEGHKVLVFSQFTKLLGFVRQHLDSEEVPYAYLDGQTRNRADIVDRFQNDPECNLFLVSLKAGGTGLNLTAAGYVFLLDPWWNPAVEAQAIDRAHRIGQENPVFAYRLIARDTVEEKILDLQKSKRQIADAILEGAGEGQSLRDLTADDLRLLLS